MSECFECGNVATYKHHIIPRLLGGTKTVALCGTCHAKAHFKTHWKTGELTALALRKRREAGLKNGGNVPFGFDLVDNKLVPNKQEAESVALIHSLRKEGLSLREIIAELQVRGIKTKTGKEQWNPQVIRDILK